MVCILVKARDTRAAAETAQCLVITIQNGIGCEDIVKSVSLQIIIRCFLLELPAMELGFLAPEQCKQQGRAPPRSSVPRVPAGPVPCSGVQRTCKRQAWMYGCTSPACPMSSTATTLAKTFRQCSGQPRGSLARCLQWRAVGTRPPQESAGGISVRGCSCSGTSICLVCR